MPLTGVHFLLSYQCTYECDHCFVWSSPRSGGTITLEMMTKVLDQAKELGTVDNVYFEGGEPFLFYPLLVEGIRRANERGFSTGVVTNCYWATNDDSTRDKLENLKQAGLKGIMISVNPFYAEHVPFERTQRCIHISQEVFGFSNVMIYQMEYYRQFLELGIRERITFKDYLELSRDLDYPGHVEMFYMGRATSQLRDYFPKFPAQPAPNTQFSRL